LQQCFESCCEYHRQISQPGHCCIEQLCCGEEKELLNHHFNGKTKQKYHFCGKPFRDTQVVMASTAQNQNASVKQIYVQVPNGLKPGNSFLVQTPDGTQVNIVVPQHAVAGTTLLVNY
jgi:hypothetical protein